jgi:hypothetical protein
MKGVRIMMAKTKYGITAFWPSLHILAKHTSNAKQLILQAISKDFWGDERIVRRRWP